MRWPRRDRGLELRLRPISPWVQPVVAAAHFTAMAVAERRRPLRPRHEPRLRHIVRNLSFGGLAGAVVTFAERPLVMRAARHCVRRRQGLLGRAKLPGWADTVAGVLLLDYTLFGWHWLTHRVPLLWRFHASHHADVDLDASSGARFHPGEMLLSIPYRLTQVRAFGISPRALTAWQLCTVVGILFHHSNLRLPQRVDRALARVVVTPRMHGIHHSRRRAERNSNWSSGILSVWDWLHKTVRLDVPQAEIAIGLDGFDDRRALRFGRVARPLGLSTVPQRS